MRETPESYMLSYNIRRDYDDPMSTLSMGFVPGSEAAAKEPFEAVVPRRRGRGLAHGLVDDLGDKIRSQQLRPGDKLPTESAIMQVYGVSRTVVREALSKLQAGGLVETHHGVGTFVLPPRAASMFRLEGSDIATTVDVLAVLELRISLETETAGLAALRRSDEQLRGLREALDDFEANVAAGGDTVKPDLRFHLLIAEATGNPYFADIMGHLGAGLIPRARVSAIRDHGRASGSSRTSTSARSSHSAVSGSRLCPEWTAWARNTPLIPPALAPATISGSTRSRRRWTCSIRSSSWR